MTVTLQSKATIYIALLILSLESTYLISWQSYENPAVKNFLVRSVALLVSCDDFQRFEEILVLLMTITSHKYEGEMSDETTARPAKLARIQLQQYIATEQHEIIRIIPEEESEEFEKMRFKMAANDQAPMKADYVLNHATKSSDNITKWIADFKKIVEIGNYFNLCDQS